MSIVEAGRDPRHARDYDAPLVEGRVVPTPRARALLLASHTIASRAWLLSADGTTRVPLPLAGGGSVACDPGQAVRRSATLTLLTPWPEVAEGGSITPYGARVAVQRGIRVATDAIEWMTLMTGPVWETSQDATKLDRWGRPAPLTVPLKDEMATIAADRFDANTSTDTTLTVSAQLHALIRRTLPAATIHDRSGAAGARLVGTLDMQQDPADGMVKVAAAAGLEVHTGRGYQEFVIAPVASLDDPPRWEIVHGGETGSVVSVTRKRTREKVYNRVVAVGETNDNTEGGTSTPPPRGEARIDDPTDPLRYGGPIGRVTRFYASPLLKDDAQAAAAAAGLLERYRGTGVQLDFTTLVNPALDGGDVIASRLADGVRRVHITDAVTVPLGVTGTQDVPTRGLELPDETMQSGAA